MFLFFLLFIRTFSKFSEFCHTWIYLAQLDIFGHILKHMDMYLIYFEIFWCARGQIQIGTMWSFLYIILFSSFFQGNCERTMQDVVERIWDFIDDFNINSVLKFLKDNVVGTVVVISLIFWVPISCLISYVDKKRARKVKK